MVTKYGNSYVVDERVLCLCSSLEMYNSYLVDERVLCLCSSLEMYRYGPQSHLLSQALNAYLFF